MDDTSKAANGTDGFTLDDNPQRYGEREVFIWAWQEYLRKYWPHVTLAVILMSIEGATLGAFSYMIRPMFDEIFARGDSGAIFWISLVVGGIFVLRAATSWFQKMLTAWVGFRMTAEVQRDVVAHLLTLSPRFFQANAPGALIERVRGDSSTLQRVWSSVITALIRDIVAVISLLYVALMVDWVWTLVALLGAPLLVVPIMLLRPVIQLAVRTVRDTSYTLSTRLDEMFHGVGSVKLNALEALQQKSFAVTMRTFVRAQLKSTAAVAAVPSIMDVIAGIGFVGVLTYGGYQVAAGTKTVGEFMSFFTAIVLLFEPVRRIGAVAGAWQAIFASLGRLRAIFDQNPDIKEPLDPVSVDADTLRGDIVFDGLELSYGDHQVLNGVSFTAGGGRTTALVGPSGAGKTTLFNLLTRMVDPDAGEVRIGGVPVRRMRLANLRGGFSVVSQEAWLFDESVRTNIEIGRPGATAADFDRAVAAARVGEFAGRLHGGLDAPAGPRGSNLSGGQRQRVAIARAMLRDAPILLLDEPTSALDAESEAKVQAALETLAEGRTTLVIAHRISTVRNADLIVVMDQGRVVDTGTHDELMKRGGTYAKLVELQFSAREAG